MSSIHPAKWVRTTGRPESVDRIVALENAVKALQVENKELRLHLVGILETAVKERVGATGAPGRDGASIIGPAGPAGKDGKDSTAVGPRGHRGEKGDSIVGRRGEQGPAGRDGQSIVGPKGDKGDSIVGPQGPRGDVTIVGDVELREAVVVLKKKQALWLAAVLRQFELNTGRTHRGLKAAVDEVLKSIERDSNV